MKVANGKAVRFERPLASDVAINVFKQAVFLIEDNSIKVEYARYHSNDNAVSNLNEEIGSILVLLFIGHRLNKGGNFQTELDIDLLSKGKLYFYGQGSYFSVGRYMASYVLDPPTISFSTMVYDISQESLIALMERLIHGFSAEHNHFGLDPLYLEIDQTDQLIALNHIKGLFFPPDF